MSRHARPGPARARFILAGAGLILGLAVVTVVALLPAATTAARSGAAPSSAVTPTRSTRPSRVSRPSSPPSSRPAAPAALTSWLLPPGPQPGHLAPGSQPSALPGPILIVDKFNNRLIVVDPQGRIRWQFPRPGDLAPGQTFLIPDDAFFTPDGREIVATQEDQQLVTVIDIATHRIVYRYGTPGVSGAQPNQLSNPDDAMMLPDGYLLSPDIKNCRLLLLSPSSHVPVRVIGTTTTNCYHAPPQRWGSPNGAFPMSGGNYLITEINGDWVNSLDLHTGAVAWSTHPPGVNYPSDTNQVGTSDRYLTVDYSSPGQAVIFDHNGNLIWRYRPGGNAGLDHPSLALPLPNGDVLITDDYNHRVLVVDPHTDQVLWQYGVRGVPGAGPGYLNNPDGLDLLPPFSLLGTHKSSMGRP